MTTNQKTAASRSRPILTLPILLMISFLAACGGGGGGSSSDSNEDDENVAADEFTLLASNDLGMHCADLDYQVFSILPPFNVVHAQVIRKGSTASDPEILDASQTSVHYSATSNSLDPAGADSINTTSSNLPGIEKSNFWDDSGVPLPPGSPGFGNAYSIGGLDYAPLYPNAATAGSLLDPPLDLTGLCDDPAERSGCSSAIALFEPLPIDVGLPVPDLNAFWPAAGDPLAELFQQSMPGLANTPQRFARFDRDLPFFVEFGFGSRLRNLNWFAADGIPILPVDDSGQPNAYPMMRVTASDNSGNELSSLDIVLPVASEADCQNCHVDPVDCLDPRLPASLQNSECNGSGISQTPFQVMDIDQAPGSTIEQQLLNAAKTNILRLHDARHGAIYRNWDNNKKLVTQACDAGSDPGDPDCLANQTPVQCARCHYTPALDLLQTGPTDEPEQGLQGRQQTWHGSMSRVMHKHHGELPPFNGEPLFPAMPGPKGRDPLQAENILEQTCYQCHPGKRTRCLRGAMFAGGSVCQDCHGDMAQVGNDFSLRVDSDNPGDFLQDGTLRVPWASEPGCQSCHTGDALQPNHPAGAVVADDNIRLLRAWFSRKIDVPSVPDPVKVAEYIESPTSRFAENRSKNVAGKQVNVLYRLSKGHGGVMCEGCHNSTHAIWPVQNASANDNIAAKQLQGHSGTLIECTVCHADDSLGLTLEGPHGMHPVGDRKWNEQHKDVAEDNLDVCMACHGKKLQGTVLSRMATRRTLKCDEDGNACGADERITLDKGTQVSCDLCHENPLLDDD